MSGEASEPEEMGKFDIRRDGLNGINHISDIPFRKMNGLRKIDLSLRSR